MKFLKQALLRNILILSCILKVNPFFGTNVPIGIGIGIVQLSNLIRGGIAAGAAAASQFKPSVPNIPKMIQALPPHMRKEAAAKIADAAKSAQWKDIVVANHVIPKTELVRGFISPEVQSSARKMVEMAQKGFSPMMQQAMKAIPSAVSTQAVVTAVQTLDKNMCAMRQVRIQAQISSASTSSAPTVSFQPTIPNTPQADSASKQSAAAKPSTSVPASSSSSVAQANTQSKPAVKLTVAAHGKDGVIADIDASNKNYAMRTQSENVRVLSNPQCKATYTAQVECVAHNLNKASNMSVSPEIVEAQLTLLNNVYEHQVHNNGLSYATKRMLEQLCTKNGEFVGCFNSRTVETLKHYSKQNPSVSEVPGNLYRNIKELFGVANDIPSKFLANDYNKCLYNFCQSIKDKDFLKADDCLKFITPDHPLDNCAKCKLYQHMLPSFNELRATIFNEHNIARSLEADTIWPQLKKALEVKGADYAQQVLNAQNQLLNRFTLLQVLLKKVGKDDVSEPVKKLFYELVSLYSNHRQAAKYLSQLTFDSPDKNVREAAALIFNGQYIPKIYDYTSIKALKDIVMPRTFSLDKNRELRELYFNFLSLDIKNDLQTKLVQQGARYIQQACSADKFAPTYKYFSSLTYRVLTQDDADKCILRWADFSQTFTDPAAKEIQQRVLPILHNAVGDWHLPFDSKNKVVRMQLAKAESIVERVSAIYNALANNDIKRALDIEKNELPGLTRNLIIEDLQKVVQPPFLQANREYILAALCHPTVNHQPVVNQSKSVTVQCASDSDKSKNLEKAPGACLPKNPAIAQEPGCKIPESKEASLPTCPDIKIKSDVDRKLEQEIEEIKKKAQEGKPDDYDCNWSKGKHVPSLQNEPQTPHATSHGPNSNPDQQKEAVIQAKTEEKLQELKKRLLENKKTPTQEEIKFIDQFIERLRKLTDQYGVDAVVGAVGICGATQGAQSEIAEKEEHGTITPEAIEEAIQYATSKIKLAHFFDKEMHGFKPLLEKMENNREKIVREIIKALVASDKLPATGKFYDVPVNINGFKVNVRGTVNGGIIKIGTMFIP